MTPGYESILTDAEVVALTGRHHRAAQRAALVSMGIRHFVRPDGSPAVPRSALDGEPDSKARPPGPDFETLHRGA